MSASRVTRAAAALLVAAAMAGPPAVAQQAGRLDQVRGPRSADGRLLGPDGAPLDDAAVEGLLDTRDEVVAGMNTEIERLEALRALPRSDKVDHARSLLAQLRRASAAAEPSLASAAIARVYGPETRDFLVDLYEDAAGPTTPPGLGEMFLRHPELAIGGETIGGTALWEALLDDDLVERLTRNPAGLSVVEQDQLLVDLLNRYIGDGIADLRDQIAALESIDRLQDLWDFGADRWGFARRRLATTDPATAARARAAEAAYAERQPALDYNRALDRHLGREAGRVSGERDAAGRLLDSNGNAVPPTTVRGLLLVRDMVEAQLRSFAGTLDGLRNGPRSTKLELARQLREHARAVRDAYVNLAIYQARATSPYDQRTGRARGYPKDAYDDLLRRAAAAERGGDAAEAARLREEARTGLYGTYRARALDFYGLLDQAPELGIELDGVRLWEALLDDDLYEVLTGRTGLSRVEIDQALVDLLNPYLAEGARQARAQADEVAGTTQIDDLIEFGDPRYTNAHEAAARLGAALGATLPGDLIAEVQAFHEAFRLTEQYEEALTRGAVDLTLTVVAAGTTLLVPVLAPAAWGAVAAVQVAWDGQELVVTYLEESEITDEALQTGHVHILSAEERTRAAEQQFIFTAITSAPDLAAAARAGRVRITPRADAAPARPTGEWLTPGGVPPTADDARAFRRQVAFDDLEEAAGEARRVGVPQERIDEIVGGLDGTSPEFDTQLAHLELEDASFRAQGYLIHQGIPDDFGQLQGIYSRARQRGGLSPEDYEVLRGKLRDDPGYLDMLDRRVAQTERGEHEILFPSGQADELRGWFGAGPLPDGPPPVVRFGSPPDAPAGGAPRRGPGDTQVLTPDETVRVRPGDETVRLPAFEEPPAGPAVTVDGTGTYRELSNADEYAGLVARQAAGEPANLSGIARPGIAKVTPDGDILVVQGAGRWENTRPDEYLDIFVDSRTPLPPESGARVIDADVPPALVRDANLLSSRGAEGANPTIVNSAIGDAPSFQRVRIPARNVEAPTSFVPARIDEILDELREGGVNTARLEEALPPLSPAQRLALLEAEAARVRAHGTAAAPDETVRLPDPDLPGDETVRLGDPDLPGDETVRFGDPDLPGDETIRLPDPDLPGTDLPARPRTGAGPFLTPAQELALRGAERVAQTVDNLPERTERDAIQPPAEDRSADEVPIGILPSEADEVLDDPVDQASPVGDPGAAPDPEAPVGEPIGAAPRAEDPAAGDPPTGVASDDAGDGVSTGDPIDYATSVAGIQFSLEPIDLDCGPGEEPGTVVDLINVAAPLINLIPTGASRDLLSQLVMIHYQATTVAGTGSSGGPSLPPPPDHAMVDAGVQPVFASYAADGLESRAATALPRPRAATGAVEVAPPGDVWVYLRSGGGLGGDAVEIHVVNERMEPVRLRGGAVVLEPLVVSDAERIRLERRLGDLRVEPPTVTPADAYCLDLRLEPPSEGTVFRIADAATQDRYGPSADVLEAARRLSDAGALDPDSDPLAYFHSIAQWAIWSLEERLDAEGFAAALVEHTRRNALSTGVEWGPALERAVLDVAPGRWRDIRAVLDAVPR